MVVPGSLKNYNRKLKTSAFQSEGRLALQPNAKVLAWKDSLLIKRSGKKKLKKERPIAGDYDAELTHFLLLSVVLFYFTQIPLFSQRLSQISKGWRRYLEKNI